MSVPDPTPFPTQTRSAIHRQLLAWFEINQRDLPWRSNRDPYRIWVSEVMLQQTTVAAVIPYFQSFLERFPTVQHLANAEEAEVLQCWQGLGYYRRARFLHAAARQLVTSHAGQLPDDPDVWAALPGVGRYTLGAVLSQAFDRRLPIVEANILRVLSRLYGSTLDPRSGLGKSWIWTAAEALLPRVRVGDFNQALMELGALVCRIEKPKCGRCPLRKSCRANRTGRQEQIPPRPTPPVPVIENETALVVQKKHAVLLGLRPDTAKRWANMWELPTFGLTMDGDQPRVDELASDIGLSVANWREVLTISSAVTRHRILCTVYAGEWTSGKAVSRQYSRFLWVRSGQLLTLAMKTPHRKFLAEFMKVS